MSDIIKNDFNKAASKIISADEYEQLLDIKMNKELTKQELFILNAHAYSLGFIEDVFIDIDLNESLDFKRKLKAETNDHTIGIYEDIQEPKNMYVHENTQRQIDDIPTTLSIFSELSKKVKIMKEDVIGECKDYSGKLKAGQLKPL
jgi:hypothetical protein